MSTVTSIKYPKSVNSSQATSALDAVHAETEESGIDPLLLDLLADCSSYAEYGAGPVTTWALKNTNAKIITVDNAPREMARSTQGLEITKRYTPHHIDLGRARRGGRPVSYDEKAKFPTYTDTIWKQKPTPEVVYINGRFRVCCFLTALKNAKPGTKIVFNGYNTLGTYKIVEEFVKPSKSSEQMAVFDVPEEGKLDMEKVEKYITMFRMVMD